MSGRSQKLLQLSLFVLSFAMPCAAQETPAWEIFGGYSLEKSEAREYFKSSSILYTFRSESINLHGWNASLTENLHRRFGGSFDVSGHYRTVQVLGTTNRERVYSILYGPRFAHRTHWGTPFAHVQIGAAHAQVKVTPVGPRLSEFSFAMAAGGGLDLRLGRMAAVRLIKAEYFRANTLGTKQNGYRVSAGAVFYWGTHK